MSFGFSRAGESTKTSCRCCQVHVFEIHHSELCQTPCFPHTPISKSTNSIQTPQFRHLKRLWECFFFNALCVAPQWNSMFSCVFQKQWHTSHFASLVCVFAVRSQRSTSPQGMELNDNPLFCLSREVDYWRRHPTTTIPRRMRRTNTALDTMFFILVFEFMLFLVNTYPFSLLFDCYGECKAHERV